MTKEEDREMREIGTKRKVVEKKKGRKTGKRCGWKKEIQGKSNAKRRMGKVGKCRRMEKEGTKRYFWAISHP